MEDIPSIASIQNILDEQIEKYIVRNVSVGTKVKEMFVSYIRLLLVSIQQKNHYFIEHLSKHKRHSALVKILFLDLEIGRCIEKYHTKSAEGNLYTNVVYYLAYDLINLMQARAIIKKRFRISPRPTTPQAVVTSKTLLHILHDDYEYKTLHRYYQILILPPLPKYIAKHLTKDHIRYLFGKNKFQDYHVYFNADVTQLFRLLFIHFLEKTITGYEPSFSYPKPSTPLPQPMSMDGNENERTMNEFINRDLPD